MIRRELVFTSTLGLGGVRGTGSYAAEKLGGVGLERLPADQDVEVLSFSARLHQTGPYQLLDVMGDRGLGHGELVPQVLAGATLLVGDGLEHSDAAGVGQRLGDELELAWCEPVAGSGLGTHSFIVIELSHGSQAG
jgi:hypothetical protein